MIENNDNTIQFVLTPLSFFGNGEIFFSVFFCFLLTRLSFFDNGKSNPGTPNTRTRAPPITFPALLCQLLFQNNGKKLAVCYLRGRKPKKTLRKSKIILAKWFKL